MTQHPHHPHVDGHSFGFSTADAEELTRLGSNPFDLPQPLPVGEVFELLAHVFLSLQDGFMKDVDDFDDRISRLGVVDIHQVR